MSDTHETPNYNMIFFILLILTIAEVGITYAGLPHAVMAFGLVSMAITKAALVAMYFMHLRFETRTLGVIACIPAFLLVMFLCITYPDTAWRYIGYALPG